jgi:AraC-like DNA-binding protein
MLRALNGTTPIANAKPVRTRDYSVELQRSGPATLPALYHNLHLVTVSLGDGMVVVREDNRDRSWARFTRGESSIHAAGPGQRVTWPGGSHCIHVHLHPRLIRRVGATIQGVRGLGIGSRPQLHDPVIRDIGLQLHSAVTWQSPADARVVHDLVIALAHYLMVNYAADAGSPMHIGRLSIEETLDVFRENPLDWAGVSALAHRAGLTRPHFSRRVRALTGVSPYAMVLGSRLEAAKHLLERRDVSLSEVAYSTGFADQSHLTRVFTRMAGVTPARYRGMRHC